MFRFKLRTLLIVTAMVGFSLSLANAYYEDFTNFFYPDCDVDLRGVEIVGELKMEECDVSQQSKLHWPDDGIE